PPAFVLSQDQTLYKMIFITSKVLNLVHSARNRLRPVNYSLGIFKCSLHLKRFRYKYSILFNFQGPAFVGRLTGDLLIVAPRGSFVKHFFHLFSSVLEVLFLLLLLGGTSRR